MPWHDWQFWCVTATAVLAALYLAREFLPRGPVAEGAPPCGTCGSGKATCKRAASKEQGSHEVLVTLGDR